MMVFCIEKGGKKTMNYTNLARIEAIALIAVIAGFGWEIYTLNNAVQSLSATVTLLSLIHI